MKNLMFMLVVVFSGSAIGQELTPTPDPISTMTTPMLAQQTWGNYFRLCIEIQADIDAASWEAGAARRHLQECQGAYQYALINSMEAAADFGASGYLDPLAVIRANYWAGQVAYHGMRVSSAESALSAAIGRLSVFEFEFASKGC